MNKSEGDSGVRQAQNSDIAAKMNSTGDKNPTHAWAALLLERELRSVVVRGGSSPLLALIHWICAERPEFSRLYLRAPILLPFGSRNLLTPTERMAIRVFAKRSREESQPPVDADPIAGVPFKFSLDLQPPLSFESDFAIAHWLRDQTATLSARDIGADRPIVALALDAERRFIGAARARGGSRRDAHAEWVLWESLPSGDRARVHSVWVSLKPCRFCATLLYPREVHYLEFDPGPLGRETVLDAASPDRRRFYPEDQTQREFPVELQHLAEDQAPLR